jgi:hypothetical protein
VGPERVQAVVQAGVLGFVSILTTAVFIAVASRAANGRLARNQWVGIRTRSTMRSDAAWMAGHRAALRLTPLFLIATVTMCAALVPIALYATPSVVQLVGFGVVAAILALVLYSAFVANKAANLAGGHPGDRQRR